MDLRSRAVRLFFSSVCLSSLSFRLEVSSLLLLLLLLEDDVDELLESVLSSALLLEEDGEDMISMSTMVATMEAKSFLWSCGTGACQHELENLPPFFALT